MDQNLPLYDRPKIPVPKTSPPPAPSKQSGSASLSRPPQSRPPPPPIKEVPAPKPVEKPLKPKPKPSKDPRLSTLSESQIMEKLRKLITTVLQLDLTNCLFIGALVSKGDPSATYTKLKKIGQGASGSVYIAKNNHSNEKVAIKQMDLAAQPRKELLVNEIVVMKESQHPNIVNYRDSYLRGGDLWVVMELMEGGPLTEVIDNNTLTEPQIAFICGEVNFLDQTRH